ncbi:MAG: MbnP family protein [Tenacibaculum sp.]
MKQFLILVLSISLFSCSSDNDESIKEVTAKFNFTQNWDGTTIEKSDLSNTEYTNKLGTKLTIKELKYLISNITLTNGAGEATTLTELRNDEQKAYKLIDVNNTDDLSFSAQEKLPEGAYNLSMTFGFNNDDNYSAIYTDLSNWTVPGDLGGGYHYMQLEGNFLNKDNEQQGYTYHTIRAVKKGSDPSLNDYKDTFITVNLGTVLIKNDATIEIKMNVAEWFKNPNEWDLNTLNSALMGNFDAQDQMFANGKSGVFSLGTISQ